MNFMNFRYWRIGFQAPIDSSKQGQEDSTIIGPYMNFMNFRYWRIGFYAPIDSPKQGQEDRREENKQHQPRQANGSQKATLELELFLLV